MDPPRPLGPTGMARPLQRRPTDHTPTRNHPRPVLPPPPGPGPPTHRAFPPALSTLNGTDVPLHRHLHKGHLAYGENPALTSPILSSQLARSVIPSEHGEAGFRAREAVLRRSFMAWGASSGIGGKGKPCLWET